MAPNGTQMMFSPDHPTVGNNHGFQSLHHKRHLHDTMDSQHNVKRRLVDHLNGLSIGKNHMPSFPSEDKPSSTLFGSFTKEQLNKPLVDPHKVYIRNIDQFLHENPDQLDVIGEKLNLEDLRRAGLDKLVVSCGLDIRKAWEKITAQYKSKNYENKNIDDLIYKMIWEDYLAKYFSLIRFYDPLKMVWQRYTAWLERKNHKIYKSESITELDNDCDEMMMDGTENAGISNEDPGSYNGYGNMFPGNVERIDSRQQSLTDGMSTYGSYYHHDEHWNDNMMNGMCSEEPMVEDVDDDIMMED